jgi:hypothetical protein
MQIGALDEIESVTGKSADPTLSLGRESLRSSLRIFLPLSKGSDVGDADQQLRVFLVRNPFK